MNSGQGVARRHEKLSTVLHGWAGDHVVGGWNGHVPVRIKFAMHGRAT
jgi:hypothetical protein